MKPTPPQPVAIQAPSRGAHRRFIWLICLVLAIGTLGVYWPVRQHDFINCDDTEYVTQNTQVKAGITVDGLKWAFGRLAGESTYWHPLTWVSHMTDCQVFGLNAGAHHLMNVVFHTLNAVLLFWLLLRMMSRSAPAEARRSAGVPVVWPCFLVAALFAWHPLQVDTVAWVAERKNVLSTLFWILTLHAYTSYVRYRSALNSQLSTLNYLLALLCFALGLMCKPMLVTLPCVFLLLDYWPLRRVSSGVEAKGGAAFGKGWAGLAIEKLPFFGLAGVSSVLTILAHQQLEGLTNAMPFSLRLANAFVSYGRYLRKAVWPVDLANFYPYPLSWPGWMVGLSLGVVAAFSFLVWRQRSRRPFLLVGWLWFLGVLVPAIGILQAGSQSMADRFAYVPLVGLFVMAAWGLADWAGRRAQGVGWYLAVMGAGLGLCLLGTHVQLRHWKDSETLFRHALAVTQDNVLAHGNLASALEKKGRLEEAAVHFREVLRLQPDLPDMRVNLAITLKKMGKLEEALDLTRQVLLQDPQHMKARDNLAEVLNKQALRAVGAGQSQAALNAWREACQIRPERADVANNLAWVLATHPEAGVRNGREAVELAERMRRLEGGGQPEFLDTLAAAYAEAGRFDEAVKTLREALRLAEARQPAGLAAELRDRLRLYQAGQPYHAPVPTQP